MAREAALGLHELLGVHHCVYGNYCRDPMDAIRLEFEREGGRHKANYDRVLNGELDGKTLDELVEHPDAKMAKLEKYHILALRLYTTESYVCVNEPLRKVPPLKPHPFAATTCFISDGIKKLRAASLSKGAHNDTEVYWRGIRDKGLQEQFLEEGGTEFACVSTTESKDVAVAFAESELPLVFKFESTDFTSRGAHVSFLSAFPNEKEVLYPPLTYMRSMGQPTMEDVGGVQVLVFTVQPELM